MIREESYSEFQCALTSIRDSHFIDDAVVLTQCGHSACRSCVANEVETDVIICGKCGEQTDGNIAGGREPIVFRKAFRRNLERLYPVVANDMEQRVQKLSGCRNFRIEIIESNHAAAKKQIQEKTLSVKKELDLEELKQLNKLEKIKEDLIKSEITDYAWSERNYERYYKKILDKIKEDMEDQTKQNEEAFYEYQKHLKQLNDVIESLERRNHLLRFYPSDLPISSKLIGEIVFENFSESGSDINESYIRDTVRNGQYKVIDAPVMFDDICVLPKNNELLCLTRSNHQSNHRLRVYTENFIYVKDVKNTIDSGLEPIGIASDGISRLFVLGNDNTIHVTNVEFQREYLLTPASGLYRQAMSICCKNNRLYINEGCNTTITIVNSQLMASHSFKVHYLPTAISVSNKLICVECLYHHKLCFYNVETCMLKFEYDRLKNCANIKEINSNFYGFDCKNMEIKCFNKDGLVKETIVIPTNQGIPKESNMSLYALNRSLVMIWPKKVVIIKQTRV